MTASSSNPATSDWQSDITRVEENANAAFLARDLQRLDELFSDDLVVNSPINRVHDKRKILELLGSRAIGHVSSTYEHELIRRDGDLVIVMGADAVRNRESEPIVRRRFTNVWRREGDRWRLYLRHATVIAQS